MIKAWVSILWCLLSLGLLLPACQVASDDDDSKLPLADDDDDDSGVIGPEGGTVALEGGGKLTIPAGALTAETEITVEAVANPTDVEWTPVGPFYDLGPDGLVFEVAATLTLPYDVTMVTTGFLETDIYIASNSGGEWQNLGGELDAEADTITIEILHFSTYGAALPPCPDDDGDGYQSDACGGDDCADADAAINPAATDVPDDGVDQDCDGADAVEPATGCADYSDELSCNNDATCFWFAPVDICEDICQDNDFDGHFDFQQFGGPVCPTADDYCEFDPYNYTETGCSSWDEDMDGRCEGCDLGADVCEGAPNNWTANGCANCNDIDGDGHGANCDRGADCDETDSLINAGTLELPDDGIDQNCDGADLIRSDAIGIFVAPSGDDDNLGTMAEPVATIQNGTDLAEQQEKVVFIAAGSYSESLNSNVSLYGGYEAATWTRDITAHRPIINGTIRLPVVEGIVIEGLSIGGGHDIICSPISSGDDCSIGLSLFSGKALIVNNIISGGSGADSSNGLFIFSGLGSNITVAYNIIDAGNGGTNTGGATAGAFASGNGNLFMIGNVFRGGEGKADSYGSWIDASNYTTVVIANNTFFSGAGESQAVAARTQGWPVMINNIFIAGFGDGENYCVMDDDSAPSFINNDFYLVDSGCLLNDSDSCINSIDDINQCLDSICTEASGNISANPTFVEDDWSGYHLESTSPCQDAGASTNAYRVTPGIDLDHQQRPQGAAIDIGADEYQP